MRLSIQTKLFLSHFAAIVLVSGSVGTFFYKVAVDSLDDSLKARLQNSAAFLSQVLDARALEEIRGPGDAARPDYLENLRRLRELQATNPDIAFIYVMRLENDRVVFVLDSDTSREQALPGQPYDAPFPRLREGFRAYAVDDEITRDRWGYFLSGYAPLKNGNGRYLVGLDMRADEVQMKFQTIRITGAVSLCLSIALAWLFSLLLARRITRPIRRLVVRTGEIAEGRLEGEVETRAGDEVGDLAGAFNTMAARLAESRTETRQAMDKLKEAHDTLEQRVEERTAELAEVNADLRREIAERERAEKALAKAATTDFLTGLLNRPAVLALIEQEAERVKRGTPDFSLILADLDHFKEINDSHGHEAGDEVLLKFSRILRESVRGQDAVARWGGDEMLLFLPETPTNGAVAVARKVLTAVSETPLESGGQFFRLTVSLGVSTFRPGMTVTDCFRLADEALYRVKAGGRNGVAAAEGPANP
ncbi:MAG: diguanylate cyclase [Acidobacteria bacterium]|nr:diguanylate cyclase [Acidobacteriota bacterium]